MEGSGQWGRRTQGGHLSIPGTHVGPNQTTAKPGRPQPPSASKSDSDSRSPLEPNGSANRQRSTWLRHARSRAPEHMALQPGLRPLALGCPCQEAVLCNVGY